MAELDMVKYDMVLMVEMALPPWTRFQVLAERPPASRHNQLIPTDFEPEIGR